MHFRWIASAVSLALAAHVAHAQDEGHEILRASADAVSRLNGAMLTVKRYGTDTYASKDTNGEARVQLLRDPANPEEWLVRVSGAASSKGGARLVDIDAVWSSAGVTWVDHKNKKVMVRPDGSVRAEGIVLGRMMRDMPMLSSPPFAEALDTASITVAPPIDVEGEKCDVVEVLNPKTRRTSRIAISTRDKLPRRFQTMSASAAIAGSSVLDILEFNYAIEVSPDAFNIPVPEGYTLDSPTPPTSTKPPESTGSTPTIQKPPAENTVPAVVTLPVAAPFELSRPDGSKLSLESLRGQVVILDFFGSWCLPARDAHAELKTMMEELAGKPVKLLALSVREKSADAPARALAEFGPAFELLTEADETARAYGITTYPAIILINASGEIVSRSEGFKKTASPIPDLKKKITELLEGATPTDPALTPAPDKDPLATPDPKANPADESESPTTGG